jgi:hypothetical protein
MRAPTQEELWEIEARLRSILTPYESRLETASIYGIPTLRRTGATAHQWFAFVKAEARHVSFFLLPMLTYPELMADVSPALLKRRTAKSMLKFTALDEPLFVELEGLVARAYERYIADAE